MMREELAYQAVDAGVLTIDNQGRIWRGKERAENDTGQYFQVRVMKNRYRAHALAHRLVWRHFKGPIPPGLTINHLNGIKKDNRPENLELATYAEQVKHARQVLGKMSQAGEKNNQAKLREAAIREIRRRRTAGESLKSIAASFGISDRTVSKIALGRAWVGVL